MKPSIMRHVASVIVAASVVLLCVGKGPAAQDVQVPPQPTDPADQLKREPLVTPAARPDKIPPPTADPSTLAPLPKTPPDEPAVPAPLDPSIDKSALVPGEAVGEGDASIEVSVRGLLDKDYNAPLRGKTVELSIIRPPHDIVGTLVALTGEDGVAHFRAEPGDNLQAFARLVDKGKEQFAPSGIVLDEPITYEMSIQDMATVSDASVVFASRIITIVELWENYTVFTQIYRLATDQPVIYKAEAGDRTAGLKIPLPEEATGIRVVQPQDQSLAEVVGKTVRYRGEVKPAGQASEAPTMIVRYSIEDKNAASVAWRQEFPFDVEDLSLVVPQTSQHDKHPHLNVDILVPLCDDAGRDPKVMCFDSIDTNAEGVQMLQGTAVRIAHAGTVAAGGAMVVKTTGWPADPQLQRWAAVAALIGGLLLALLLFARGRARSSANNTELARLTREREIILDRVGTLEQQLADAAILEIEYEAEREQIIGELALIERRLRSLNGQTSHG